MDAGYTVFALAVTGFLIGIIHITPWAEKQRKAEIVLVKVMNDSHLTIV